MSAVPINDNDRPLGLAAFQTVRALGTMPTEDLRALLAHIVGHLSARVGAQGAREVTANILKAAATAGPMSLQEVAFVVACKHGVPVAALRAPSSVANSRIDAIAIPRHEAFWLARQQLRPDGSPKYSLPMVGRFFGGRDHSTVLYGVRRHRDRLARASA